MRYPVAKSTVRPSWRKQAMANLTTRQSEAVTTLLSLWRTGTIPPHAFTKMATVESEALVRFLQKVYWDLRFNGHAAFPFDDEVAFQRYLIQNIETIPQQEAVQDRKSTR